VNWWFGSGFDREASQTRDYCVAKDATHRAARPDPPRRKERLLGMTMKSLTCEIIPDINLQKLRECLVENAILKVKINTGRRGPAAAPFLFREAYLATHI
jgi:hypothetical protein